MKNRLPIFSSDRVGKDWNGEGGIGEPIPWINVLSILKAKHALHNLLYYTSFPFLVFTTLSMC
jgi:hypothetical protein